MTRPGAPQDSYYLSCRLFSPRNVIVSEPVAPSADKSEINFGLQHSLPFPANQPFLDKYCRENHLVLEVWGSNPNVQADEGGRNLVGLATVPLNQIWETFHDESKLLDAKDSDLPLLVFNDWVPVYDVSTGGWQVWSLTQLYSVEFSQSRIGVKSAFSTNTQSRFVSAIFDIVLGPLRLAQHP